MGNQGYLFTEAPFHQWAHLPFHNRRVNRTSEKAMF